MIKPFNLIFFVLPLFLSCGIGDSDVNQLSGGYTFRNKGLEQRSISPNNIILKNFIYADIIDYAFNDKFIVAEQKPTKKYLNYNLGELLYFRYVYYADYLKKNTLTERNLLDNADSINYITFLNKGASINKTAEDDAIYVWDC